LLLATAVLVHFGHAFWVVAAAVGVFGAMSLREARVGLRGYVTRGNSPATV
jgi:hypothetical protein